MNMTMSVQVCRSEASPKTGTVAISPRISSPRIKDQSHPRLSFGLGEKVVDPAFIEGYSF
jgi:hypothetical protein